MAWRPRNTLRRDQQCDQKRNARQNVQIPPPKNTHKHTRRSNQTATRDGQQARDYTMSYRGRQARRSGRPPATREGRRGRRFEGSDERRRVWGTSGMEAGRGINSGGRSRAERARRVYPRRGASVSFRFCDAWACPFAVWTTRAPLPRSHMCQPIARRQKNFCQKYTFIRK